MIGDDTLDFSMTQITEKYQDDLQFLNKLKPE